MIDFTVAYDKLSNFETAQEIREYFNSLGLKGFTCQSNRCPIASFITEQTGEQVLVEPYFIARDVNGTWQNVAQNTEAMAEFINNFDDWDYPELIHQDELDMRYPHGN